MALDREQAQIVRDYQVGIPKVLAARGPMTAKRLAVHFGVDHTSEEPLMRSALRRLRADGVVKFAGAWSLA